MREWNGTIDSIKAKQDRTGETIATVMLKISTWDPEEDLPELLGMLKSYVAVSMRESHRPDEGE